MIKRLVSVCIKTMFFTTLLLYGPACYSILGGRALLTGTILVYSGLIEAGVDRLNIQA